MKSGRRLLLVSLALLAGVGAFWRAPGPGDEDKTASAGENDWALPTLPLREAPEQAYQRLRQLQPWGRSAALAAGGATTVNWRLRGITRVVGDRPYALIEEGGGKARRYQVGETLPRGEKLLAIHADRIEIETPEAERRTLVLYQLVEAPSASNKSPQR